MEASVGGHYQCARVLCREFKCDCNMVAFLGGVTGELYYSLNICFSSFQFVCFCRAVV